MSALLTFVFIANFLKVSLAVNNTDLMIVSSSDPRPWFCIKEATLRQSVLVGEFENGSCALWSSRSHPTSELPLFKMLDVPNKGLLLLKTHQRRSQDPSSLLVVGRSNFTQPDQKSLEDSGDQFRSPLIDLSPSPFSHVHVVLRDQNGTVVVNLTFSIPSNSKVADGSAWFGKNQLVAALPWSVSDLTSDRVHLRFVGSKTKRCFIMRIKLRGLCNSSGYLLVLYARKSCTWQNDAVEYIWSSEKSGMKFESGGRAAEFLIYGTLRGKMNRWYLRD